MQNQSIHQMLPVDTITYFLFLRNLFYSLLGSQLLYDKSIHSFDFLKTEHEVWISGKGKSNHPMNYIAYF